MPYLRRTHSINPRLGLYYGICASLFVATGLLALLIEELGAPDRALRWMALAAPLALYAALAVATMTSDPVDFFAAGRRIPAFFSGLALSVTALGSVGIIAVTGAIGLMGMDGFALLLGWPAGLVFMGVLIAPYLRKFGAFSLPTYLGGRLDSRLLRVIAASVLAVPMLLILVAEIRMATFLADRLVDLPPALTAGLIGGGMAAVAASGGLRSVTWTGAAKAMALLLALAVPVTIISVMSSTLPLPQMTSGNVLRNLARTEVARNLPLLSAAPLVLDLPGAGLEPFEKRFLQMYGHTGALAFSGSVLVIIAGIAAMPGLLQRAGTTPGVHETRKSIGWAVLLTGFLMLTLVSAAIYLRSAVVEQIIGQPGDRLPLWFQALQQEGLAAVATKLGPVAANGVSLHRDGVLIALPTALGLPAALTYLLIAGALAAALAAIAAHGLALGASLAEDVVFGYDPDRATDHAHVLTARVCIIATLAVASLVSLLPADPLTLVLWALAMTAASAFPVLVMSVLWKRLNAWGAVAGMLTGLGTTISLIVANILGVGGLQGPLPGIAGMISATVAALVVTRLTPQVGRHVLEVLRDLRVPGGETIMDRQRRIVRQKRSGG